MANAQHCENKNICFDPGFGNFVTFNQRHSTSCLAFVLGLCGKGVWLPGAGLRFETLPSQEKINPLKVMTRRKADKGNKRCPRRALITVPLLCKHL